MKKFEILRYLKRFSILIFLVSLAGAAAIYLYADGKQQYTASICAVIGEIFGTGIIGSMVSYPVMAFLMGRGGLTAFYYTPMFLAATTMGGCVAYIFLKALSKAGLLVKFQAALGSKTYETKNFTTAKAN